MGNLRISIASLQFQQARPSAKTRMSKYLKTLHRRPIYIYKTKSATIRYGMVNRRTRRRNLQGEFGLRAECTKRRSGKRTYEERGNLANRSNDKSEATIFGGLNAVRQPIEPPQLIKRRKIPTYAVKKPASKAPINALQRASVPQLCTKPIPICEAPHPRLMDVNHALGPT